MHRTNCIDWKTASQKWPPRETVTHPGMPTKRINSKVLMPHNSSIVIKSVIIWQRCSVFAKIIINIMRSHYFVAQNTKLLLFIYSLIHTFVPLCCASIRKFYCSRLLLLYMNGAALRATPSSADSAKSLAKERHLQRHFLRHHRFFVPLVLLRPIYFAR